MNFTKPDSLSEQKEDPGLFIEFDPSMNEALSALRSSAIEPEPSSVSRLEVAVIRGWRIEKDIKSWQWWVPVFAGCAAGAVIVLAWMQFWGVGAQPSSLNGAGAQDWPRYSESGD